MRTEELLARIERLEIALALLIKAGEAAAKKVIKDLENLI